MIERQAASCPERTRAQAEMDVAPRRRTAGGRLHQHCRHTQREPPTSLQACEYVLCISACGRQLASRRMRQHQKCVQGFAARADPAGRRAPPRFHAAVARCSSASLMRPPAGRGPGSETGCECSAGVADTGVARVAVPLFASSPRCSAHQLAFAEAGACAAPRVRVRSPSQQPMVPHGDAIAHETDSNQSFARHVPSHVVSRHHVHQRACPRRQPPQALCNALLRLVSRPQHRDTRPALGGALPVPVPGRPARRPGPAGGRRPGRRPAAPPRSARAAPAAAAAAAPTAQPDCSAPREKPLLSCAAHWPAACLWRARHARPPAWLGGPALTGARPVL